MFFRLFSSSHVIFFYEAKSPERFYFIGTIMINDFYTESKTIFFPFGLEVLFNSFIKHGYTIVRSSRPYRETLVSKSFI